MSYTQLLYHVVFATKERRSWLSDERLERLSQYIRGIAANEDVVLYAASGFDNHIHLLFGAKPHVAISDFMRIVKTNSSRWLRSTMQGFAGFSWQDGYSAFTVSQSLKHRVKNYVENQQSHHHKMSFDDEIRLLLKRHNIAYHEEHLKKI